jgi:hypothetical protein
MKTVFHYSLLILLTGAVTCTAAILEVPQDFITIGQALRSTSQGDTVIVSPGIYSERLILPGHDFFLTSEFHFTQDSAALYGTVIDAGSFANEDTAAVLTFVHGNSRATVVSGFTLRGGHGVHVVNPNPPYDSCRIGGCIYIAHSHPTVLSNIITDNQAVIDVAIHLEFSCARIAQNLIAGNSGDWGLVSLVYYSTLHDTAVVEWNDIAANYGPYTEWPYLSGPIVSVTRCGAAVRYNRFHDYSGNMTLGVYFHYAWGELVGNRFERLTFEHIPNSQDLGEIAVLYHSHGVAVRGNVFRDCTLDHPALNVVNNEMEAAFSIEQNWFENIQLVGYGEVGSGWGPAGLLVMAPHGTIRQNVFVGCVASGGAMALSFYSQGDSPSPHGCQADIEENQFIGNRISSVDTLTFDPQASALSASGNGTVLCNLQNNRFEGNERAAIDIHHEPSPVEWDCRGNYWGDPTGPYHPVLNPEGRGDTVGDDILFDPWLTSPPSQVPSSPVVLSPSDWKLEAAFPNPFNASTQIRLVSSRPQPFEVVVYDLLGRRVCCLWRGVVPKDTPISIRWDGHDETGQAVATGLYFVAATPQLSSAPNPKVCKVLCLR